MSSSVSGSSQTRGSGSGSGVVGGGGYESLKLFISPFLDSTRLVQGYSGCFSYRGHRVKQVEFVGLVVEVLKQDRYTLFTLDDSTQCIKCWLWRPTETAAESARGGTEGRLAFEVRLEMYHHLRGKVDLGQQIKVQGRPHWFQEEMQIKCFSIRKSVMLACFACLAHDSH